MLAQKENLSQVKLVDAQPLRLRYSRNALIVIFIISALAGIAALVLGIFQHFWPLYLVSVAFVVSAIIDIFALTSIWDASFEIKILAATLGIEIALIFTGGVFSFAYGLPTAFLAFFIGFMFASYNPTLKLNEWIIGLGLFGALGSTLLGVLAPLQQISNPIASIAIVALDLAAVFFLVKIFLSGFFSASLRLKLLLSALAIAIVPLIILAVVNLNSFRSVITSQSDQTLRIATELTINQVDDFFTSHLTLLETEASLPVFSSYLALFPASRHGSTQESEMITSIKSFQSNDTIYAPSYAVLNYQGDDLYDTDVSKIGKSEATTDYFQKCSTTQLPFASTVEFVPYTRESYIYFITPIFSQDLSLIGYLRINYDSHILQTLLQKNVGLIGSHSYPLLIDDNGIRLADTSNPDLLYHSIQTFGTDKYTSLLTSGRIPSYIPATQIAAPVDEIANALFVARSQPFQSFSVNMQSAKTNTLDTASYGSMTTQKWYVVFLQEQSALIQTQQEMTRSTALIAVLIIILVSILVGIISNFFTQPIIDLTNTSKLISAGNLDAHVNVNSHDEIGELGRTFNSMAAQLKSSFETLDKRVAERTQELAQQNDTLRYRSRQLQTVTDVARTIVSSNDMESLLVMVTQLISNRFNFYHAGIFLLDEKGEFAVLRASNSTGGQRMLNRQHKLRVGQVGIVGYVTGSGLPRIATDVGKDAVFFNNPDLPDTKSEMALPLKIEDRVIGALDIQSVESNAFSEEDVALFTTLADQVSIAINNNQLLSNTQKALDEAQSLHRQYLNQEWTKRAADLGRTSYKYTSQGLTTYDEDLPEVKMVFESGHPVTRSAVQDNSGEKSFSTLAVPILLRGEVIGVIHLQEHEGSSLVWSERELLTVQTLADELAQTLENARLFEQTIRRADRERRVLEITSKIRSTNDPQKMLEITLEELKRHLGASQAQIVINLPGQPSGYDEPSPKNPNGNSRD
jgi:GAF domain-containing protein/HAMP domain-containing protein